MLSSEIKSIHAGLGTLAGTINEEAWALVRQARANLETLAERAEDLESHTTIHCVPSSLTIAVSDVNFDGLIPVLEGVANE